MADILDTRNRVEEIPGVVATIRRRGVKLYLSAAGSKSVLDEVEALIGKDWPKAVRTSGSYGATDFDTTWRVNP